MDEDTLQEIKDQRGDDEPDNSDRVGNRIGGAIAGAIGSVMINISLFFSRLMPFSHRFWSAMIKAGYRGIKSKGGADYVGHVIEQGRLYHRPVTYKTETEGPTDDPRFVDNHGNEWKAPDESTTTNMVGKVPTMWASAKSNQAGNHVQAEVAEVLDVGGGAPLTQDATVNKITVDAQSMDQGAVADGGYQTQQEHVSVQDPGALSDYLVDLNQGLEDAAGRVVSMEKYYETYPSQVDPEEMEQQHLMGRLAEKDPGADRAFIIKIMLIVLGIIALVMLGPGLVDALFGGGGGGGSVGSTLLG